MTKKSRKMKLDTLLEKIPDEQEVVVDVYAYGISYANTLRDGMRTAADVRERCRYDILQAGVYDVQTITWNDRTANKDVTSLCIRVEMVL